MNNFRIVQRESGVFELEWTDDSGETVIGYSDPDPLKVDAELRRVRDEAANRAAGVGSDS